MIILYVSVMMMVFQVRAVRSIDAEEELQVLIMMLILTMTMMMLIEIMMVILTMMMVILAVILMMCWQFQVCYIDPVNMAEDRGKLLKARYWENILKARYYSRRNSNLE